MLYIRESNTIISDPNATLSLDQKNYLFENMKKGLVFFIFPDDFDSIHKEKNPKHHKKVYKIGFLYDVLSVIYPDFGKEKKHEIIDQKFHLLITYRQFKDQYDIYYASREKYLKNRALL